MDKKLSDADYDSVTVIGPRIHPNQQLDSQSECHSNMGLIARKPVFGVSVKTSFKPVSSATETSYKIEISPVARLNMVLSKKRITKALIRLRGCAGWSAPVLFANPRNQAFSRRGPYSGPLSDGNSSFFQIRIYEYIVRHKMDKIILLQLNLW